ncbi:MAG: NADPH:quinone oxidoreductase family protein [Rhizobiaceae bacterium]|nr:NADPH:quinone oxidoreductase family protein [Rhizobiaceae bacterium]
MKALVSHSADGPEALTIEDVKPRDPGEGELLLEVLACGVNFTDVLFLLGLYQEASAFPLTPGGEVSGIVRRAGAGTSLPPGSRVMARCRLGGMAEMVTVPEDRCLPVPDTISDEIAAIIQFSYATAYYALTRCTNLREGDRLLVLGASGGVGGAAVAIGRSLGARVFAATSSPDRLRPVVHMADEVLEYPADISPEGQKAFRQTLREVVPEGFDSVIDPVGGALAEPAIRSLASGGCHMVIGFAGGIPSIPLNLPLLKAGRIVGVSWHDFLTRFPAKNREMLLELFGLYESGRLEIAPPESVSLEGGPRILQQMQARQLSGKWVVLPSRAAASAG